MASPMGCYNIPYENMDKFYNLYQKEIDKGTSLHMTEAHLEKNSKIIVDIDLRFGIDDFQRKYTLKHITDLITLYTTEIETYLEIKQNFTYHCFVMERDKPRVEKGQTKDGIHLVFDISTEINFQKFLRSKVIQQAKTQNFFDDIEPKNDYNDIFDRTIITGLWQVYGSSKPNCKPYKVTHIFQKKKSEDLEEISIDAIKFTPRSLSIREINDETNLKILESKDEEIKKEYQKYQKKKKVTSGEDPASPADLYFYKFNDINVIRDYVNLLSVDRANSYQDWIEVGGCLHNIDKSLLQEWINFSHKSSKYKEGECEELWADFRNEGLGLGTLHRWAKMDDPVAYNELKEMTYLI